jgi:chromosome segregation ATPase
MYRVFFVLIIGFVYSSSAFSQIASLRADVIQLPKANQNEKTPIEDYESVINEYTKYLAGVPKEVKEEEIRYLAEMSKIDKEIAKLRQKRVLLNSKLSESLRDHQNTKMIFEQKLNSLSKFKKYPGNKTPKNYKQKKEQEGTRAKAPSIQ